MRITEYHFPRTHIVCDDFLSIASVKAVLSEIRVARRQFTQSKVRDLAKDHEILNQSVKNNLTLRVLAGSRTHAKLIKNVNSAIYSKEVLTRLERTYEPIYQLVKNSSIDFLQISAYGDQSFYSRHIDVGSKRKINLTFVLFISRSPKSFSGGNLELSFGGEKKVIRFRSNRLIIFPSNTPHQVTRVRLHRPDFRHFRFSIQAWPVFK